MPRVDLTVTSGTTRYPTAGVAVTMTAADTTNKERFVLTGREILVIQNTGAGAHTYTITSTADPQGRTSDISAQSIAAGAIHMLGPLDLPGWAQTSGQYLHIEANHTEVKWGVYRMP
jgi:hypothetical protein